MTNHEYLCRARQDFLAAGPEGHYPCPASQADGDGPSGTMCVAFRACDTANGDVAFTWLEDVWDDEIGEQMIDTNERGYAACVAAYDKLILHHVAAQSDFRGVVAATRRKSQGDLGGSTNPQQLIEALDQRISALTYPQEENQ